MPNKNTVLFYKVPQLYTAKTYVRISDHLQKFSQYYLGWIFSQLKMSEYYLPERAIVDIIAMQKNCIHLC